MPSATTTLDRLIPPNGTVAFDVPRLCHDDIGPDTAMLVVNAKNIPPTQVELGIDFEHETIYARNLGAARWPAKATVTVVWGRFDDPGSGE